jgi:regulator of protease activity HflC (stomatin/prohibitin superfamily)
MSIARCSAKGEATADVIWIGVVAFVIGLVVSSSIQVADQWDKVVILRLGHFHSLNIRIAAPFPIKRKSPGTEDKRRWESHLVDQTRFPVLWSRYEATP